MGAPHVYVLTNVGVCVRSSYMYSNMFYLYSTLAYCVWLALHSERARHAQTIDAADMM